MSSPTTSSTQWPPKPMTAAQRASERNREEQMKVNVSLGRETPPPRVRAVSSEAGEDRFKSGPHRR